MIRLRALEPEDLDLLYKWENDQTIWDTGSTIVPFSKYTLRTYIEQSMVQDIFSSRQLRLMIDIVDNNSLLTVGMIDLYDYEPIHKRAGIGILLDENYRKKGIAKQAVEALITFAKNNIPMHQLYCNIASKNIDSIALFTSVGFTQCGEKKQWLYQHNEWVDEWMFQKILD